MKKLALIFGASFIFSSSAFAQVIDPTWKTIDLKIRAEKKKCAHIKNIIREEDCISAVSNKYQRNGDVPVTQEYIKKNIVICLTSR